MKINQLAKAAAEVAESSGWRAVTSLEVSRRMGVNRVSVSRTASLGDILHEAAVVVQENWQTYPRAMCELALEQLDHHQRLRVVHAIKSEVKT